MRMHCIRICACQLAACIHYTSSELFIVSQGATNLVKYFATGMEEFLPFGEQVGDRVLLTDTSASLTLDVPFVLYGVPHTELFVSAQSILLQPHPHIKK